MTVVRSTAWVHRPAVHLARLALLIGTMTQAIRAQEGTDSTPTPDPMPAAALARPLNLHLVAQEGFLNRIVARDDVQPGAVQDVFEDTKITGQQVTATHVRLDFLPSMTAGIFQIVLEGDTSSQTSALSPQSIVVNTVGRQHFHATKDILFDGYQLATRHAVVAVRAENRNVGAVTKFTGRPLGPLVEQVVLGVAEKRQPEAQAFARRRVVENLYPQFDSEIDAQLAAGNRFLKETLQERLEALTLMPDRLSVRTTDDLLHFAASVAAPSDLAALEPAPNHLVESHGVSVYLHDSLFQGIIERAQLAGRKTTSQALLQLLERTGFSELPSPSGPLAGLNIGIELADVDPVLIRFGDEETRLTLRAKFKVADQDLLPFLEITIPFRIEQDDDEWAILAGPVLVHELNGSSEGTSLAETAVKKAIESALPKFTLPRRLPEAIWPAGKLPPEVTSVHSGRGWLIIGVD